jgi:sugar/nucleoside kinase (ribokinase family)
VISVFGRVTLDYLYLVDQHPEENSENPVRRHAVAVGGPAGRGAVAMGRLGATVRLASMLGTDIHAERLRAELEAEPLTVSWFSVAGPSQHSCVILAADRGTRSTFWRGQPEADERLLDTVQATIGDAQAVFLDCSDECLTKAVLGSSRSQRVPVVVDTGSYKPWAMEGVAGADFIMSPRTFFSRWRPDLVLEEAAREAYEILRPRVLVATLGERGGLYLNERGMHSYGAVPVAATDSCGAGDVFHAAFTWATASGMATDRAVQTAAWVAARKTAALGNGGLPTERDVDAFLLGG